MANKKISQLTPKGSALAGTDLLEVSVFNGATYDTKSLTGANVVSGLQPTLVSGTSIKTINSTTLLGSGDIVISTGLTVGTTPITSGTVGRVLFEGTGNVVQQDSTLFWDNTNKRLGVGATPSTSVRLDVRAQGALSTDVAFRVRNSVNTGDLLSVQGDGKYSINDGGGVTSNAFSYISDGRMFMAKSGSNFIEMNNSGQNRMYMNSNGLEISVGASNTFNVLCSTTSLRVLQNSVQINSGAQASSGTNYLMMQNGTAPSANATDHYNLYSADITAGNAAPHFRTENGNVIKIYRETTAVAAAAFVANTSLIANDSATFGGYTMGQVVAALKAQGLLA